jgi:imidazolonepropionase-like amidohydrolase
MKFFKYIILNALVLFWGISIANTQAPPDIHKYPPLPDSYFSNILKTKGKQYAIKDVNIIPMNFETVSRNNTVLVKDGKIQKIGLSNQIDIPSNYEVIDGKGKYLLPGLNDMHVHFYHENDIIPFIANGVTTVRNMQGEPYHLRLRDKINKGVIFGPAIYTTGPYITNLYDLNQVKTIVPECKKSGFDYLKIYGFLSDECYREIMKQSRLYGIKAVGHLPYVGGLKVAIEEKQHTIEHIMQLIAVNGFSSDSVDTRENIYEKLRMVAQSGTWLCITHTRVLYNKDSQTEENIQRNSQYKYFHPAGVMVWLTNPFKEFIYNDLVKESLKYFFDLNGKIILGTDCGMPFIMPGFSVHEQMGTFVSAGLTPYQALRTCTYNASECLGILDKSGTIEEGKNADLLLLNGNPLENINNTRKIEGVMLKGVWFPQNELQDMLDILSGYYRDEIIPLMSKYIELSVDVKNIYIARYQIDSESNLKSRIIFGVIVITLLISGIFIAWKIRQKNKLIDKV